MGWTDHAHAPNGSSGPLKNPRHGDGVVIQFFITNRWRLAAGRICRSRWAVFLHRTRGSGAGEPPAQNDPGTCAPS
jgi:hypothetical protein